mgnify:CR=1 FL=1
MLTGLGGGVGRVWGTHRPSTQVELPLEPREFATGVALFAVMPTTLSSGYIFTGEAKGNQPLSLLLSIGTNLLGAVSVPLWLSAVLNSTGVELDVVQLLTKMILSLLVPLTVGRLIRCLPRVPAFVKRYNITLKLLSATFLVIIPYVLLPLHEIGGSESALMCARARVYVYVCVCVCVCAACCLILRCHPGG